MAYSSAQNQKALDPRSVSSLLSEIGIDTVDFDAAIASHAAELWPSTRNIVHRYVTRALGHHADALTRAGARAGARSE